MVLPGRPCVRDRGGEVRGVNSRPVPPIVPAPAPPTPAWPRQSPVEPEPLAPPSASSAPRAGAGAPRGRMRPRGGPRDSQPSKGPEAAGLRAFRVRRRRPARPVHPRNTIPHPSTWKKQPPGQHEIHGLGGATGAPPRPRCGSGRVQGEVRPRATRSAPTPRPNARARDACGRCVRGKVSAACPACSFLHQRRPRPPQQWFGR